MQSENDEGWIGNLEEQLIKEIENEPDYDRVYIAEKETTMKNVWGSFQESATSIAQLYKERINSNDTGALWLPFQTAAGTVTSLYKESCEGLKRSGDAALQCGYQRRTREIVDWARSKRRRYIRRDELLSYLAGKPPPPPSIHVTKNNQLRLSPKPETHNFNSHNSLATQYGTTSFMVNDLVHQHLHQSNVGNNDSSNDLHTFKEALARRSRAPELYAFVAGEIARHCKRPASPLDVNMEVQSVNNKRQRFI